MKLAANWKVKSTPELIEMSYKMTLLHLNDFRRALYGQGNYRLYGKHKRYMIKRNTWQYLDIAGR